MMNVLIIEVNKDSIFYSINAISIIYSSGTYLTHNAIIISITLVSPGIIMFVVFMNFNKNPSNRHS